MEPDVLYSERGEPLSKDEKPDLDEKNSKESISLKELHDSDYILHLKNKTYELIEISDCSLNSISIEASYVRFLRISDSTIKWIRIINTTGLNWSISSGFVDSISLKKVNCSGDLYVTPGFGTRLSLNECSAGDHLTVTYSDSHCNNVTINLCSRIDIFSNNIKNIKNLHISKSNVYLHFNASSFVGEVKILDCNVGGEEKKDARYQESFTGVFGNHDDSRWELKDCTFERGLTISNCHLAHPVNLSGSKVSGLFDLSFSTFYSSAFISKANFDRSTFRGAKFKEAFFLNTEFTGPSDFSNCKFLIPPQFMGASLHQGTTFHKAIFPTYSLFSRIFNKHQVQSHERFLAATLAYRVLKSHMAKIRSQHDEMMFFALEMRTTRKLTSWWSNPFSKLLSLAYDWVSIYGLSPGRALLAFLFWVLGYAVLFASLTALYAFTSTSSFPFIVGISSQDLVIVDAKASIDNVFVGSPIVTLVVQNALNPFAIVSTKSLVSTKSWWVVFFSIIQSVGVVAIAALLILAIRSRFQKGSGGGDK